MMRALTLIVAGAAIAGAVALGSFVIDNLPPFPTCAALGGGCSTRTAR
jgi:hypothetical protein